MARKQLTLLRLSFFVSLVAMFGSLFFSEVMRLPPCVLCWYQRICMFPLAVIFCTALLTNAKNSAIYSFVLSLIGLFISTYHNLLYYKIIPDSITPCSEGISCTSKQIEWLGFITIPFLSFFAFLVVCVCCFLILKLERIYEKQ